MKVHPLCHGLFFYPSGACFLISYKKREIHKKVLTDVDYITQKMAACT